MVYGVVGSVRDLLMLYRIMHSLSHFIKKKQSVGRLIGTLSPLSVGDTGHVANATMIMITVYGKIYI